MRKEKQSLLQSISAHVPGLVVRRVLADPYFSSVGREERMDTVLLFADVSGFTAMSESLARLGKEGAEELTRVLNAYFSAMIDLVRGHGGEVIDFGGDAITCAFMGDQQPGVGRFAYALIETWFPSAVHHACACALAMQDKIAAFQAVETKGGTFNLHMKIGISAGAVLSLSVGDPQIGLEYVLAGRPLERMAQAEHCARAGEVIVDGACATDAGTSWQVLGVSVGREREGFLPVRGLRQTVEQAQEKEVNWDALSEETAEQVMAQLVPYLPPTVVEQIVEGQPQFVGEHRRVVSLFVNFFGLDYADPQAGPRLQRYCTTMQEIVQRYGGRLNRVTTGDKGSVLHVIFGAPVAHEDDEVRAVGCALEMQREATELKQSADWVSTPRVSTPGLPFITDQRIGIATGYVFAGNVGAEQRREYTVMGDVVNLSARLMQAAGRSEILTDRHTAQRVEGQFICHELAPIRVKGKREPVPVCRVVGVREEVKSWKADAGEYTRARARRRASPIVGRERELALIKEIIERAAAGQGQLLAITGEAGVGKSRLLEELVALARRQGMIGMGGDCLSYGSQSPYLPWIDFLTSFFGLGVEEATTYGDRVRRIEQRMVQADPTLKDWVPLMGQLLGLAVPDNELTASLDAQLRKQRTFDVTLTLLRHQARQAPLFLIVFEDVHWIDAISLELLNYVARNIADYPILLVALYRPTIALAEWQRYEAYSQIDLADLPAEDALTLVRLKLGLAEVPAALRERVLRGETRVNPFFVEEVLHSLVDQAYLVPREDGPGYVLVGDLSQVEISDSIQALMMSRIDRLDESSKLTVKVASVIGRTFKYRTLEGAYPVEIAPERLHDNLDRLSRLDLTPLDRPAPEWEYVFKHIITREVAYESLLFAHRRELHHRIAEYLERTATDSPEERYETLAHHYYQSGDREKSWFYLVKAGDKARDKYANEAAVAHYTQALSMGFDGEGVHHVYESLGDVYRLIGQYEKALEGYRQALERCPPAATQVADVQRKIAKVWELQGQYDEAMHYLDLAGTTLGDERKTAEMARITNEQGWVHMQQGDYQAALRRCAEGLEIAERLPDDEQSRQVMPDQVRAELQHTLGTIHQQAGDYARAIGHFQACIQMRESMGDLYGASCSYNNLAAVYWGQGDYDLAAQYIQRSLEISQRIGNTYGTAMCTNNLGAVAYTLGDTARAIEYYERSLEIRKKIGDNQGIADVYNNLGEVFHGLGKRRQALHYLKQAAGLFVEMGNKPALADTYRLLAEVALESNDVDQALEHGQCSLKLAQQIGNREYEGIAYRVLGKAHRAADRLQEARQWLQGSVETLLATENRLELGRSTYELGLVLIASPSSLQEGRTRLQEAVQIFEALNVTEELEKARAVLAGR